MRECVKGEGSVANVQVLPFSNVANFQLSEGCWGAGRAEAAASPRCGALACAGEFARAFLWVLEDVGRKT